MPKKYCAACLPDTPSPFARNLPFYRLAACVVPESRCTPYNAYTAAYKAIARRYYSSGNAGICTHVVPRFLPVGRRRRRVNNACKGQVQIHLWTPPTRDPSGIFAPLPPVSAKACTPLNRGIYSERAAYPIWTGCPLCFSFLKSALLSWGAVVSGNARPHAPPCRGDRLSSTHVIPYLLVRAHLGGELPSRWAEPDSGHQLSEKHTALHGVGIRLRPFKGVSQCVHPKPDLGRRLARHPFICPCKGSFRRFARSSAFLPPSRTKKPPSRRIAAQ